MTAVSVIVLSKNVREYIGDCINSLVNQTLKPIEVIVLDAFSDDGTREEIKGFIQRDSRVHLVDDELGSTGWSVNKGISLASGEYIAFIEADDYVEPSMFEDLWNVANAERLDFAKAINYYGVVHLSNGNIYREKIRQFDHTVMFLAGKTIDPQNMPELAVYDQARWNGIYNVSFLKENGIKSNETKGASYQDMGFLFQVISAARKAMYIDNSYYNYRLDNPSSSVKAKDGLIRLYNEWMFSKECLKKQNCSELHWLAFYRKFIRSGMLKRAASWAVSDDSLREKLVDVFGMIQCEFKRWIHCSPGIYSMLDIEEMRQIRLLVSSVDAYLSYCASYYQAREEYIQSLFKFISNTKIVIFGAGITGKRLFCLLDRRQYSRSVVCFCDNNPVLQGQKLFDKNVLPVSKAVSIHRNCIFLVASDMHSLEMMWQLNSLGIAEERIYLYKTTGMEMY